MATINVRMPVILAVIDKGLSVRPPEEDIFGVFSGDMVIYWSPINSEVHCR